MPLNTPHTYERTRAFARGATDRPSVSAPLAWEELESGAPPALGPRAVLRRLEADGDRFEPALTRVQSLREPS